MNIVIISGRLGRDPELKQTATTQIANFSVCVVEKYKQNGELKEQKSWVNCQIFGNSAINFCNLVKKGDNVILQGKIRIDVTPEKTYTKVVCSEWEKTNLDRTEKPSQSEQEAWKPSEQPLDDLPF